MYQSTLGAAWERRFVCLSRRAIPAALAFVVNCAWAQSPTPATACDPAPATAASVQGTVEAQRVGTAQWAPVKLNDKFCPGDTIRVGEKSRADIALLNQSVLRLNANSTITVESPKEGRKGVIGLLRGATHVLSRGPNSLDVQTPFTLAGVRGTEFLLTVDADATAITVFEGTVVAENSVGTLALAEGQSALAARGKAPTAAIVARPRDAVQWTLYYPPVIYFSPDEFPAGSDWRGSVRTSLAAYGKGDITGAFAALQGVPADVSDPRFFTYRAHLELMVGRVDDARADIDRALKLAPTDANAASLQVIVDIVTGDKDKAFATAQRTVAAVPNSATAWIALSYAQQARFDLPGARQSLEKAVELAPQNALAWARLAEIQSSFGELNLTLAAAQKAVAADPNLSRTQMVLGFAYLVQVKTAEARSAFEKAIALDQADPMPRLGLGLAKIRAGNLDEGGRDLEIAASLDPNNSIVRSYLGKTYYEEKRSPLDEREYAVAKQLDPKDPTPYFYDAIAKQTTNRPVEALRDMEKAIELNDNRAVYRSQLLLDADLAARSASLARIYSDLGFQDLALVEGWKSVNTDPSNFSAHRFLADSYSALHRHEIARVSELLQSQLLQPLNMTPIQPHLAESNLFLSSGGPTGLSFNEFNPLFNRNGATFQASGLVGGNSTGSGEVVAAGIQNNMALSAGAFYFSSDGFRPNASQRDTVANIFYQWELSPQASIQAEYRYRHEEHGDLQLRFFPDEFFPGQRTPQETNVFRLGGRYNFSPSNTLLASATYSHARFGAFDTDPFAAPGFITSLNLREPQNAWGAELQDIYRSAQFNLVAGGGYFKRSGTSTLTVGTVLPPPDDVFESSFKEDVEHSNVYLYGYLNYLKNVTVTLGVSGDFINSSAPEIGDINQVNPKFGVMWEPMPGTTIRAAAFRVEKRTLITDQTLEPTQVAGFNQFFDDFNGTKAWRYGAAWDQKFTRDIFGGIEISKRDLKVPAFDQNGDAVRVDWEEGLARAYLFWTPHPWWALRAEYQYERIRRDELLTDGVKKANTQRVPLGVNFFHPSGFGAALLATYYHQNGDFESIKEAGLITSGSDTFWNVDAALNYRLPKRYGLLSLGVTNLFDKKFNYFDTDFKNPSIQPDRVVYFKATIALP
jgi:tetratricopeptide (TPR) repeat protein